MHEGANLPFLCKYFLQLNFAQCSECGIILRGRYFSFKDKFICEEDYKKNQKNCYDCGEGIKCPYYTLNSDKVICEKDYKVQLFRVF